MVTPTTYKKFEISFAIEWSTHISTDEAGETNAEYLELQLIPFARQSVVVKWYLEQLTIPAIVKIVKPLIQ